jgi:hypothetical protein
MTGHPAGIKLHRELCELLGLMLLGVNHMVAAGLNLYWPLAGETILKAVAAVSMTLGEHPRLRCTVSMPWLTQSLGDLTEEQANKCCSCMASHCAWHLTRSHHSGFVCYSASSGASAGLAVLHDLLSLASLPLVCVDRLLRLLFHLHLRCLTTTWLMMRGRYKPRRRKAMAPAPGPASETAGADSRGTATAGTAGQEASEQSRVRPSDDQGVQESLWGMPKQVSDPEAV